MTERQKLYETQSCFIIQSKKSKTLLKHLRAKCCNFRFIDSFDVEEYKKWKGKSEAKVEGK